MPQGDFTNFSSTTAAVAVGFLGGYLVWVGWWAPRVVALLKVRNWLSRASTGAPPTVTRVVPGDRPGLSLEHLGPGLATAGVLESAAWPEAFLVVVQFALLFLLVARLGLPVSEVNRLAVPIRASGVQPAGPVFLLGSLTSFLATWSGRRNHLFVGGPAGEVTGVTEAVLLNLQATPLSGSSREHHG